MAQSTVGVARVGDATYEILDVGGATLADLVLCGALDRLAGARVVSTLEPDVVALRAPVVRPGKLVVVGLNYLDHAIEVGMALPPVPRVHLSAGSSVSGPTADIPLPAAADAAVDFEGELAVVIGTPAARVAAADAWSHVAAITAANDVTARDVQDGSNPAVAGPNVGLAKGFDGFTPLGPALVTGAALRDEPRALRTWVDGELRQDSSTAAMHFAIPELIARISEYTTLHRGDVILTGTPAGVGVTDGRFLRAGELVEVELEGVGTLRNRVVAGAGAGGASSAHEQQKLCMSY